MEKVVYKIPEKISKTTGEVVMEEKEMTMLTRPDVPFRSITDLKKAHVGRVNTEPSVCNTKGYVSVRKTIAAILERHSQNELMQLGLADNIDHPEEYDGYIADDDGNLTYVGEKGFEAADVMDIQDNLDVYDQAAELQLQISEQSTNVGREQSAGDEKDARTTRSEAASGDNVD